MESLSIPLILELRGSQSDAMELIGKYKVRSSCREFTIRYEEEDLTINLFLRARLIRQAEKLFLAEGWNFEDSFEAADDSRNMRLARIGGKDVKYLSAEIFGIAPKGCWNHVHRGERNILYNCLQRPTSSACQGC
jgi:hypothetical protein